MALPPGLNGFFTAQQQNAAVDNQRLSGLAQLQQMQQAQYKLGLENQFRQEIAGAKTPEEQLAVAGKYMGPDAVGKMIQSSQDRQASMANTREIAMTRLQQAKQQFDANTQVRLRLATTAEERNRIIEEHNQGDLVYKQHAAQLGSANALYNTGMSIPAPTLPAAQPAPSPQAAGASSGLEALMANRPPAEQAAIAAAASDRPTNLITPQGGGLVPAQGDAAYQAPAGPPIQQVAPVTPASSYGTEGRFPSVGTAAPLPAPVSGSPGEPARRPVPILPRGVTAADAPPGTIGVEAAKWARDTNHELTRAALRPEGGGILNTNLRMQESLKREIAPYRKVLDAYERFQDIRQSGDTSQANLLIAQQLQQMSQTGQRAFTKRELETSLGSGDLGGNWASRVENAVSQAIAGVRTPEIDKTLNASADAMARAAADRVGDSIRNARSMVPSGMNADNLVPGPMIMGRFIVSPTGKVHAFANRAEAQARLEAAAQQMRQ